MEDSNSNLTITYGNVSMKMNESIVNDVYIANHALKPIVDYLVLATLLFIMFSMGCEITWMELFNHMKKPIGITIGLLSQFFMMPLTAYAFIRITGIDGLRATGILIISCCPGGALSNVFALYTDGDLSLSVAMTSFSTLLALGLMPMNMWIYGHSFETKDLVLPYENLAMSLILVTTPVAVGMLVRWKIPQVVFYFKKCFGMTCALLILSAFTFQVIVFPELFHAVESRLYAVVLTLPLVGMTVGFVLAFACRQSVPIRKTIAFECGIQNVPTAIAIITMSFKAEQQQEIILLPWLYGYSMISLGSILCISYQIYKHCKIWKRKKERELDIQMMEGKIVDTETSKK